MGEWMIRIVDLSIHPSICLFTLLVHADRCALLRFDVPVHRTGQCSSFQVHAQSCFPPGLLLFRASRFVLSSLLGIHNPIHLWNSYPILFRMTDANRLATYVSRPPVILPRTSLLSISAYMIGASKVKKRSSLVGSKSNPSFNMITQWTVGTRTYQFALLVCLAENKEDELLTIELRFFFILFFYSALHKLLAYPGFH